MDFYSCRDNYTIRPLVKIYPALIKQNGVFSSYSPNSNIMNTRTPTYANSNVVYWRHDASIDISNKLISISDINKEIDTDDIASGIVKNNILNLSFNNYDKYFFRNDTTTELFYNRVIENSIIELRFIKSYKSGDNRYDSFLQSYKEFYIGELFNQNYYNIINQNYIIFIQKMMEHYGIKYIMCDAFENMLIDVKPKDDVTKYINKKVYWGFGKKCFKQLLYEQKEMDIWEKIETSKQDIGGIHPNKKGYQIIYNEVYEFLKKLNYV